MLDTKLTQRLFARQTHGIKPGLDTTRTLLERLGNPQQGLAAIHVAGTNGKGSVCAMLAAGLNHSGARVGLYTSPHLIHFNERFVINGREIDNRTLNSLLSEIENAAEAIEHDGGQPPTFFECATAAALLYFQRQDVKLAVIETGLGGRLDATSVITPLLSVITRIGLDHTEYLGSTLTEVAGEKAGIIKPGRPVVMGAMPPDAAAVIAATARQKQSPLIDVASTITVSRSSGTLTWQKVRVASENRNYGTLTCRLAAPYQLENIATVTAVLETLESHLGLPLPEDTLAHALAEVIWRGRFQMISDSPPTIVDGAHNQDGASALARAIKETRIGNVALVCGFCADKDVDGFFRTVAPIAKRVWTVPISNPRSMDPQTSANLARHYRLPAQPCEQLTEALQQARARAAAEHGTVVVCGSLFLAGVVLGL